MAQGLIQELIQWMRDSHGIAGMVLFVLVFVESLLVVGWFVPAVAAVLTAGGLIAVGAVAPLPALLGTMAGAFFGGCLSYWIGRRYRARIVRLWPFSRRPRLISRSRLFFRLHGGKGLVIARFSKPLRPVLPAVAGMSRMPPRRFLMANLLAVALWASAWLVIGFLAVGSFTLLPAGARLPVALGVAIALVMGGFYAWRQRRLQEPAGT